MPDLIPEEIPQARVIAYVKALARGNGKDPPPYDPGATIGDFWQAASEMIAQRPVAPFEVHSVHFAFPSGKAIQLVDPAVNQPNPNQPVTIGATPEWVVNGRNELAAYVRGTRPNLRIVFRGTPLANGTYTVGAGGSSLQVTERQVTLDFDPVTRLSVPEEFQAAIGSQVSNARLARHLPQYFV